MKVDIFAFCVQQKVPEDFRRWALQWETLGEVYEKCPRSDWLLFMLRAGRVLEQRQAIILAADMVQHVVDQRKKREQEPLQTQLKTQSRAWLKGEMPIAGATPESLPGYAAYAVAALCVAHALNPTAELKWQADLVRRSTFNPWTQARAFALH